MAAVSTGLSARLHRDVDVAATDPPEPDQSAMLADASEVSEQAEQNCGNAECGHKRQNPDIPRHYDSLNTVRFGAIAR